jgi:hypothetical protein
MSAVLMFYLLVSFKFSLFNSFFHALLDSDFKRYILKLLLSRMVIFCYVGDNWRLARTQQASDMHVINPLSLHVDLFQCMVVDSQLPRSTF